MPIPSARILNPFVPRDDLGIEEDISNRLYLPSDVSLSLATMVGRNGRKPRIVQMDDDGRILVSFGNEQHTSGFTEFLTVADNQTVNHADTSRMYDVTGVGLLLLVGSLVSTTDISDSINFSVQATSLDKSTVIGSSAMDCSVGSTVLIAWSNIHSQQTFGRYIYVEYAFSNAPASAVVNVELYLA